MSRYVLRHLQKRASDKPFKAIAKWGSTFERELRHLLTIGLVERIPDKGIRSLFDVGGEPDVKQYLRITEEGRRYLEYHEQTMAAEKE